MKKTLFFLSFISLSAVGQAKSKLVCQQITLVKTSYDVSIELEKDSENLGAEVGKASFTILGREQASISCKSNKGDVNRENISCKGEWTSADRIAYFRTWVQTPPTSEQKVIVGSLSVPLKGPGGITTVNKIFLCGKL